MFEQLEEMEKKYEHLTEMLTQPEIIANQAEFQRIARAQAALTELAAVFRDYRAAQGELSDLQAMLADEDDHDMRAMIAEEEKELDERSGALAARLRTLLLPRDPDDEKNVIVEIRAGTGGEEAALFAGDLYRMYTRYGEARHWKNELLSASYTDIGGFREIIFMLEGRDVYSRLKFESGVHRVQRIPATESSGRVHTSAATVAVLPEAAEVEIDIDPNDLRIDIFCSSGPGGQSVNTTQSAIRVTHLPTGLVVSCQDEKSQHKNKDKALRVLRARLLEKARAEAQDEMAERRRNQVGTGDRSERIRTYNFPQGRVSDHRIGLTLHKLDAVLLGDLDPVVDALTDADQAARLRESEWA
ncbi:MAG: peptide chain release factor 1 [Gracilibacteraceae bacterium]|jgi:peptide chain release factor 1|nr:peptide chain release factor 1 [Gracilibacteraceae bacterium]